jgi:hypothetical protein
MILVLTSIKKNTVNSITWPDLFIFRSNYSLEKLPPSFSKELFLDFDNYINSFSDFPVQLIVKKYYYVNNTNGDTITCRIFDDLELYNIFENLNEENKTLRSDLFKKMDLSTSIKIINDQTLLHSIIEAKDISYEFLFNLL